MADGLLNKASIILTPTGYKAGTLYNVAPVVEPYEDFDFARASVASRVNSSGLVEMVGRTLSSELVTNGDFATDSDWNKGSGWSISGGEAISIGGANFTSLNQEIGATSGKTYKVIFTISEYTSGQLFLNIQGSSITYTSADTFTAYVVAGGSRLYFVSGSGSNQFIGKIDNISVKEIIDTNNIPRISYDSNGDNGHILLEPTSTNLIPYSEDFTTYSIQGRIELISNSTTSPDGLTNSTKIIPTAVSGTHKLREDLSTVTGTFTQSIFAKQGGYKNILLWDDTTSSGIGVNLDDLSIFRNQNTLGYNIESFDDGWVRVSVSYSLTSQQLLPSIYIYDNSATPQIVFTGDGTSGIYIWGAQLEALSYATSYIPTLTGSTETRATETATGAGSADLINSTEGVLYAEIAALVDTDTTYPNRGFSISDGSISNTIFIYFQSALNIFSCNVLTGGVTQFYNSTASYDVTSDIKVALKYKTNDFALWINGVEVATQTSGNAPSGLNKLSFDNGGGGDDFYGKCKALAVFNQALSDSELTQLTT